MAFSPPYPLKDHCSVINDNTLYVYSSRGLQALPLKKGGKWKKLPSGVSVDGAKCVRAVPAGDSRQSALYIVGGTAKAGEGQYSGLQKFIFADQKWQTIVPMDVSATKNRVSHGATYINSTNQILTYAGSTDPSQRNTYSSATFLISLDPPFAVQAMSGPPAPPLLQPMLFPLDESHAVMIGGAPTNSGIYTFDSSAGWVDSGIKLSSGLQNPDSTKCSVVSGGDGSVMLEIFNLGVKPNVVSRVPLNPTAGAAVRPRNLMHADIHVRQTSDSSHLWPAYNASLAPSFTRTGYSIAENPASGWAYITSDHSSTPLSIFNQREASWVDPATVFGAKSLKSQTSPKPSSSLHSSTSPSATSSASTAPSAAAANNDSDDSQSQMLTVLGATLGSIFGIAALLVVVLLLLRWRRERNKRQRQSAGYLGEKDRLSFVDRGEEFMKDTGDFDPPNYTATSEIDRGRSSAAIVGGFGQSGHKRGIGTQGSDASTAGLIKKGPLGISEPMELARLSDNPSISSQKPAPRLERPPPAALAPENYKDDSADRSRSSGWSRYFANNETTNLAQMGPARGLGANAESRSSSTTTGSFFAEPRRNNPPPRPLDLDFTKFDGTGSLKGVASGSPTLGHSGHDIRVAGVKPSEGMKAELSRGNSSSSASTLARLDADDPAFSSSAATNRPITEWTTMPAPSDYDNNSGRRASSIYTNSARGSAAQFGGGASSSYYSSSQPPAPSAAYTQPGAKPTGLHPFATGGLEAPADRESTMTVFPRGVPSLLPQGSAAGGSNDKKAETSDMSWLNLGQHAH